MQKDESDKMTVMDFLRNETKPLELCVIRDEGYIVASCWIDYEDIFMIPDSLASKRVKSTEWGTLSTVNKNGFAKYVECHFIDV